jgi:tRNA(Arg) A34 adenosine deaminase TadA
VSNDDERFMREALAVARIALEAGEVPVRAVVVVGNEIVAASTPTRRPRGDCSGTPICVHSKPRTD